MSEEQYFNIIYLLIVIALTVLISGVICSVTILEINEMVHKLIKEIK